MVRSNKTGDVTVELASKLMFDVTSWDKIEKRISKQIPEHFSAQDLINIC